MPPEFYCAAFDHAVHGIVAIDDERRIVAANAAATELLGSLADDLSTRPRIDPVFGPNVDSDALFRTMQARGAVRREMRIASAKGALYNVDMMLKANVVPGVHICIMKDVTANKERELSSRRYELLREYADDIVLFVAKTGRIVEANRAAEKNYGYDRVTLLSMHARDLWDDSRRTDFEAQFQQAFENGAFYETLHRRKDGTSFPVEVDARKARVGDDTVLLHVIRDVTERGELIAHLLEADRLATFGMMAAGIAHEVNNPLAYVLANAEVLARTLPRLSAEAHAAARGDASISDVAEGLSQCEGMLRVAMEGLARVRTIVRDLKTFSRSDPEEGILVDLHQVLDSAVNVAQSEIHNRAQVDRQYGDAPPVRGSTSRLGQVFLNLIVNGAQAIPPARRGNGHVRITTSQTDSGWARVDVSDDGVGIPPSTRSRLFKPFHTTKSGEGTGLGLFICRTIIDAHGGTIEVQSEEGVGTTVSILLPPYDPSRKLAPLPVTP